MAVNLVNVGTINRITFYQGQPGTSSGTLGSAVAASTSAKLGPIIACNTTTSAATFTLDVVPSGGSAGVTHRVFSALTVGPNATVTLDTPVYMSTGDFLAGLQGTSGAITLTISAETYA